MKSRIFLFVVFISLAVSAVFAENVERVLTEEECIKIALSVNHDILIDNQSVLLAEQRTKEARTLYYPTLDLNLNVSKFENNTPSIINSYALPFSIYLPNYQMDYLYSARVSLWQKLYNGGKTSATNKLAKIRYEQVQNEAAGKNNQIIANIKTNFYKNIAAKQKIDIYKKYIQKSKNIKDRELLEANLEILQHQYELDMLDFLALMGLSLDTVVELSGEISFYGDIELNLQQCILWAYQFRPEMKSTQYQENIDTISVNLINMERYPTVVLGASYDWLGDDKSQDEKNWYVSLNLNYPIFDGGAVFTRIKQNKIKSRQATIERAKIEEKIKLEVRKAYNEYNFWYNKVVKNNKLNFVTMEQELLKVDTMYNYIKSFIALQLAAGKPLIEI